LVSIAGQRHSPDIPKLRAEGIAKHISNPLLDCRCLGDQGVHRLLIHGRRVSRLNRRIAAGCEENHRSG